jgi:hypothetical protein
LPFTSRRRVGGVQGVRLKNSHCGVQREAIAHDADSGRLAATAEAVGSR